MTRFSVIIPTYNRKDYLLECLETVFAQSYAPYEVIVVDDGSTDGTIESVEKFGRGVHVIQQANSGPGAARNRGASIARGDYLAFLDSDDLWLSWTLATFALMIQQHSNPALLAGKLVDFIDQCELSDIVFQQPVGTSYPDFFSSHAEGHFCGAGMIAVKRDIFQQTGGFAQDRLNAEDHDLALTLGTQDGFVQILNPATVCYRRHADSETTDLGKTFKGLQRLVTKEKTGQYPGGRERGLARKCIIATSVRAVVIGAAKAGKATDAAPLYFTTFWWNLRFGRVAYLAAVPIFAAYKKILGA
jgi:glycosyltransferase involved in cell wall biosynthesis